MQDTGSVTYTIAWLIFNRNCNGYVPILDIACGSGGTIGFVDIFAAVETTSNASCTTTSASTVRCVSDYNVRNPNVALSNSVLVTCSGSQQNHYQASARALAQTGLTCSGNDTNFASHAVGLTYYNHVTVQFISDHSCQSTSRIDNGLCFSNSSCTTASLGSNCSTSIGPVGCTQNLPLPSNAISFSGGGGGGSSAPNPTPSPAVLQPSGSPLTCPQGLALFRFELLTDRVPQETGWELRCDANNTLLGSLDIGLEPEIAYAWSGCISPNTTCYRFVMTDSGGDGICCGFGDGAYFLFLNEVLIFSGAVFGSEEVTKFGGACSDGSSSTPVPTPTSSTHPTQEPTRAPLAMTLPPVNSNPPSPLNDISSAAPTRTSTMAPTPGNSGTKPSSSGWKAMCGTAMGFACLCGFVL